MTAIGQRSVGALALGHPHVRAQRRADFLLTVLMALIPAGLALGVTIALPHASLPLVLAVIAGALAVVTLVMYSRLEVTVTLVLLYLALLDGPIKMLTSTREATAVIPDVLIIAVSVGALLRILARRQRLTLPPLGGWVLAWVVLVLINAFNPKTQGVLPILAGFRNQLAFVPFFFFGYALMRSKRRFRQLFIIAGVAATASGLLAAYQTGLSPPQLASWGPGYAGLIHPENGGTGRVFFSEGEARVRPPGLGSEAGASGSVGRTALPMCLALVAITRRRRKWIAALLCLGSMLAVIVGLGRLPLISAGLGVLAFAGLATLAGRHVSRTLGTLIAIVVLAIPTGAIVVTSLRSGTFKRYERIGLNSETTLHKQNAWSKVPEEVAASPFGFGLGNSGATGRRFGANQNLLEGHGLGGESQYNVLVKELGGPGLILWPLIAIVVSVLIARRIRGVRDGDLAICLAGALAAFIPLPIEGFSGFLGTSLAGGGAYFWFAIGVAAYWFAGPGRALSRRPLLRNDVAPAPAPA
jgi:hypothetical protein